MLDIWFFSHSVWCSPYGDVIYISCVKVSTPSYLYMRYCLQYFCTAHKAFTYGSCLMPAPLMKYSCLEFSFLYTQNRLLFVLLNFPIMPHPLPHCFSTAWLFLFCIFLTYMYLCTYIYTYAFMERDGIVISKIYTISFNWFSQN